MSEYQCIEAELRGLIGIITLNRPKVNAINTQMVSEIEAQLIAWHGAGLRAVVLRGSGKCFAAGADIAQMAELTGLEAETFARKGQRSLRLLEQFPAPTIAAVHGYALGGGCELAMCCDIILAGERAVFGQPEVKLGVIPGFGGTHRLVRRVGRQHAMELMFSGRSVKADEAVSLGIALRKVSAEEYSEESSEEPTFAAALALAEQISANGPVAVRLVKQVVDSTDRSDIDTGLSAEATLFGLCFATEDQKEGMNAFLEKRAAQFKDQ
jgi:enoyl-CoA hydratase